MKFLCLHGTDTNTEVLKMQLAPITFDLERNSHTFHYLNGPLEVPTPSSGLDASIPGPFCRYYDRQQIDTDVFNAHFSTPSPATAAPEGWFRQLRELGMEYERSTKAREYVLDFAERSPEGPFDGIIAFSEGTAVAADVILHQARVGSTNPFKCAVFFCGAPPWDYERQKYLLADENGERIGVPTVSVVGAKDMWKPAGMALFDVCEGEGRVLVEHPGGHVVPRSLMSMKAMVGAVRKVVKMAEDREAEAEAEKAKVEEVKVEVEKVELTKVGVEKTGVETVGFKSKDLEMNWLRKNGLKKTDLENLGMRSEWEDVADMVC